MSQTRCSRKTVMIELEARIRSWEGGLSLLETEVLTATPSQRTEETQASRVNKSKTRNDRNPPARWHRREGGREAC